MVYNIYILCEYRYYMLYIYEGIFIVDVRDYGIYKYLLY